MFHTEKALRREMLPFSSSLVLPMFWPGLKVFLCKFISLINLEFKVWAMSHFSLVVLGLETLWGVSGDHGQGRVSVRGTRGGSVA